MRLMMLVTASALFVAGTASAQPADVSLTVQANPNLAESTRLVPYGDLVLASAADQRVLHARVDMAITDLCDASHFSVADPQGSLKCAAQAWADVAPQLSRLSPRLASR